MHSLTDIDEAVSRALGVVRTLQSNAEVPEWYSKNKYVEFAVIGGNDIKVKISLFRKKKKKKRGGAGISRSRGQSF